MHSPSLVVSSGSLAPPTSDAPPGPLSHLYADAPGTHKRPRSPSASDELVLKRMKSEPISPPPNLPITELLESESVEPSSSNGTCTTRAPLISWAPPEPPHAWPTPAEDARAMALLREGSDLVERRRREGHPPGEELTSQVYVHPDIHAASLTGLFREEEWKYCWSLDV